VITRPPRALPSPDAAPSAAALTLATSPHVKLVKIEDQTRQSSPQSAMRPFAPSYAGKAAGDGRTDVPRLSSPAEADL
jgi:hypothetical protein